MMQAFIYGQIGGAIAMAAVGLAEGRWGYLVGWLIGFALFTPIAYLCSICSE